MGNVSPGELNAQTKQDKKTRVLVVDDERGARMTLEVPLRLSGYEVMALADAGEAIKIAQKEPFDLLLTDVYMPGIGGLELVRWFREFSPETKIIVMTGQGSLETAMQAVEQGAIDFIAKPFDIKDVLALVRRATETLPEAVAEENIPDFSSSGIVGHSPQMVRVYKMIAYAAKSETNVLIEGETGTGKELVARAIHNHSGRASKPFTAVNCSTLTETLLESELFGYVKGSFTGAASDRAGLFESTAGGTVFLDEISSASPSLQASLLRVIQEREIRRVGSNVTHKIDVRIIAASNADLEKMADAGEFRADLFYRLSVLTIPLPPLRERGKSDLQLLVHHLLKKYGDKTNSQPRIAEEAVEVLEGYDWTGNVRELENAIEYAVAVCSDDLIRVSDLPGKIVEKSVSSDEKPSPKPLSLADDRPPLEELNRRYVRFILAETEGNKLRAAEILGINRRTLYRYLDASGADFENTGEADKTPEDSF